MIVYFSMLETESDRDVFQKLYEENRQKLYYIARKIVHNEADAEDAVHTCFLKLADSFAKYRYQPYDNLVKISNTIVRNAALDIAREYARKGEFMDGTKGEDAIAGTLPDILDQLVDQVDRSLVTQALMTLTEEEREFLNLQYAMELKPREISKLLGMSSDMVRKKMHKCRNKLAKALEGYGYEGLQ